MILDTIIERKKEHLKKDLETIMPKRKGAISQHIKQSKQLFVIGEIKKASPSKGVIVENFDVLTLASAYQMAGVDAMSILTEQDFFLGKLHYITQAKEVFHQPILRKDFIMDVREIIQSKQAGADLILLIVAMLNDEQLQLFYQCARALQLECIIEVHNEEELTRALRIDPEIIGINNRNLHTFDVTLQTTQRLAPMIPKHIAIIAESGIFSHEDFRLVKEAGVDGVLIGESFMRSDDFKKHLENLRYGTN